MNGANIKQQQAVLAGGCFWGMEELIRKQPGVIDTTVGYTGGIIKNPRYKDTHHPDNRHAEAVEVIFDPSKTSYRTLLEFFFQIHDPTTPNRQGNDVGASYRSAIFYVDDAQHVIAQELIAIMNASGKWPGKIVTELVSLSEFYAAEAEHQDYLQKHPGGYSCHFIRPNWKVK